MEKQRWHSLNDTDTDFKATVRVAELLENGELEEDEVAILPAGPMRSAYARDMKGSSFYYSDQLLHEKVLVEVNREGLYDMLPEGLFHVTPAHGNGSTEQEMISDVRLRREEELHARRFFMPFEAALYHMRTLLEWYENRLDKRSSYDDLALLFAAEWEEFAYLDNEQRIVWMHLLPLIQHKRNDLPFIEALLSVLFNVPVSVRRLAAVPVQVDIAPAQRAKLGGGPLGSGTIIGRSFADQQDVTGIQVGPLPAAKLLEFMPGTSNRRLIDRLTAYLLPVTTAVKVILPGLTADRIARLGKESIYGVLGYTAYL